MRISSIVLIGASVLLRCDWEPWDGSGSPTLEEYWELSEKPAFSISESSQEPSFQLFNAWSGVILNDETIAVGNHGTQEVILFDYEGRALKVIGGTGSGPGEFQTISGLFVAQDGLGVWDPPARRLSTFSSQGEYLGSTSLNEAAGGVVAGVLDGMGVVTVSGRATGDPRQILVWNAQGETVLDFEGPAAPAESLISWTVSRGEREMTRRTSLPPACIAYAEEAVIGGVIFALVNGSAVQGFSSEGNSWEVYRATSTPRLTERHLEAVRGLFRNDSRFSELDVPEDVLGSALRRIGDIGDPLPAWVRVSPDPSGRLWLERGSCGAPLDGPKTFDIIDVETGYVASVVIPKQLRVLGVRDEWVLVLRRGNLDVEHVELYELRH